MNIEKVLLNNKYEVLTPDGFKDFFGIMKGTNITITIVMENGITLECSPEHKMVINGNNDYKFAKDLTIGEYVLGLKGYLKIINIEYKNTIKDLYEFIEIEDNHTYYGNDLRMKQCLVLDEFAWVPSNVAEEFWTSVYPTITSGKTSKVIMVSCVVGNTRVVTNKGIFKVESLIKQNKQGAYRVRKYSVLGLDKLRSGNIMVNSGYAKTIKFTFTNTTLECAEDHKLLCCTSKTFPKKLIRDQLQWKKAIDITKKDYVVIQKGMDVWGNKDYLEFGIPKNPLYDITHKDRLEINEKFAYFLGIMNARATFKVNGQGKRDVVLISKYNYYKFFKYDLELKFGVRRTKQGCYEYTFYGSVVYNFFQKIGFKRLLKDRIIPDRIFEMSRKNVKQYLRGIFDNSSVIKTKRKSLRIESPSRQYLEDIRTLLLNFGILSTFTFDKTKNLHQSGEISINHYVYLELRKNNAKHFFELIGYNRPEMKSFKEFFSDAELDISETTNIVFQKYRIKESSNNYVYDFSLEDNPEDPFCHSVAYNNIVGHQTPNGINRFYHIFRDAVQGKNNFRPVKINWWEMPGRDKAWKESIIKDIGEKNFQVEYNNRFLGSNSTLIDPDILEDLGNRVKEPISFKHGYLMQIYEEPIKGALYILGVDSSRGTNKDYSVVQVLKVVSEYEIHQVAMYRCNTIIPHDFAQVCIGISEYYEQAYMMVESNDVGGQVADTIYYEFECDRVLNCDLKGLGIRSTKKSKSKGNNMLKRYLENGWLRLYDKRTVFEFTQYEEHLPDIFAANPSENDDAVMSLMWALYFIDTEFFDGKNIGVRSLEDKYRINSTEDTLGNLPIIFDDGRKQVDEDGFSWDN